MIQGQGQKKQRALSGCVRDGERPSVGRNDFFCHRKPQTVMSFFRPDGGRSRSDAVEAVKNFFFFSGGNARAVILYADGNFFFERVFHNEEKDRASGGRVGEGVFQKNMTRLS